MGKKYRHPGCMPGYRSDAAVRKRVTRKQPLTLMKNVPQGHDDVPSLRVKALATANRATAPNAPPSATRKTFAIRSRQHYRLGGRGTTAHNFVAPAVTLACNGTGQDRHHRSERIHRGAPAALGGGEGFPPGRRSPAEHLAHADRGPGRKV